MTISFAVKKTPKLVLSAEFFGKAVLPARTEVPVSDLGAKKNAPRFLDWEKRKASAESLDAVQSVLLNVPRIREANETIFAALYSAMAEKPMSDETWGKYRETLRRFLGNEALIRYPYILPYAIVCAMGPLARDNPNGLWYLVKPKEYGFREFPYPRLNGEPAVAKAPEYLGLSVFRGRRWEPAQNPREFPVSLEAASRLLGAPYPMKRAVQRPGLALVNPSP